VLFDRTPKPLKPFFKPTVLQRQLRRQLFELIVFLLQIFLKAFLACLQKLFTPLVINIRIEAFPPAEIGDAGLSSESF